ncbi:unnamed protein product [Psylliodes chrysocephalus]|uniref:DUF7869 domain-containing protein n=1 Tax=Psylliodes chrysocephalus TaxID=3402493 RepID=A0A9P0CVP3_9CUCU|nr:unnamed protein product [Psylliodes chrysocephala]
MNVYNLTAHNSTDKQCYCVIWRLEPSGSQPTKCRTCIRLDLTPTEENINKKQLHLEEVNLRRTLYVQDAENEDSETKIYSADLQKVFLLPRMPKVKDSFFTSRLVAFNETFAVKGKSKKSPHYCILRHEGKAGRRADDVACSFIKFIQLQRDAESLIIWMDNFTGQNKNWVLYSALIVYINSEYCTTKNITLKYLLTGHTYMAADGLHGKIEQYVKKVGNVEDFNDFAEACNKAVSRNKVICLEISDFMKFENVCKSATGSAKKKSVGDDVSFLKDIVEVRFIKGQQEFFYKTDFRDEQYKETKNLIKRKTELNIPKPLTTVRGVSPKKKDDIMKALVPAMKPSKRLFWENLPTNLMFQIYWKKVSYAYIWTKDFV